MEYSSNKQDRLREADRQEKELLVRSKKYGLAELNINMEAKRALIGTLKTILGKKYSLSEKEYIILIDRFKLDGKEITKNTIEELLIYLNTSLKFNISDSALGDTSIKPITHNQLHEYPTDTVRVLPKRPKRLDIIYDLLANLDIMDFNGTYTINLEDVQFGKSTRLSISEIYISPELIHKYQLGDLPFILVKVREFNNNILVNSSRKYYYTRFTIIDNKIVVEKNQYIPDSSFDFKHLNLTFYTHSENILKIIDFTELRDYIKVVLVAKFK
tara:strand:+ start:1057 stop:1872 length:816 start_codon:yes stop_codon:yes gene_type:complete